MASYRTKRPASGSAQRSNGDTMKVSSPARAGIDRMQRRWSIGDEKGSLVRVNCPPADHFSVFVLRYNFAIEL